LQNPQNLTEDQRAFITKATGDIFETGGISQKTISEFGQRTLRKIRPPGDE
jgi:hypothetical protein